MTLNIIDIINLIIIFQLLVFTVFLFHCSKKHRGNLFLGVFMLSQAFGIFNGFVFKNIDQFYEVYPHLFFIGAPFTLL